MSVNQKTAKINMFFGLRFGVVLEWVLEGFWEAKNLNFGSFFEQKSKAKKHDVLEGPKKPSRRGKKQSPEALTEWGETEGRSFLVKLPSGGVLPKTNFEVNWFSDTPLGRWPGELRVCQLTFEWPSQRI